MKAEIIKQIQEVENKHKELVSQLRQAEAEELKDKEGKFYMHRMKSKDQVWDVFCRCRSIHPDGVVMADFFEKTGKSKQFGENVPLGVEFLTKEISEAEYKKAWESFVKDLY